MPKTSNVKPENEDDDEEMPDIKDLLSKEAFKAKPAAKKTKGKAKATRKSTRKARNTRRIMDSDDEEEEEGDDQYDSDLSDFIVRSDEDEEEKDARREQRKKTKKRIIRRQEESESELDDDIEVIIDPKQKKAMLYKGPIKVLPKQLPSTKMIVSISIPLHSHDDDTLLQAHDGKSSAVGDGKPWREDDRRLSMDAMP